jgi:hypothetical protein
MPWVVVIIGGRRGNEPNWSTLAEQSIPKTHQPPFSVITMSRRAAIVEEFDDDTELPLPSRSLPDTGLRGAILEEIAHSDDDDGGDSDEAPDLLHHSAMGGPALQPSARDTRVTDITPYKKCARITQSQT